MLTSVHHHITPPADFNVVSDPHCFTPGVTVHKCSYGFPYNQAQVYKGSHRHKEDLMNDFLDQGSVIAYNIIHTILYSVFVLMLMLKMNLSDYQTASEIFFMLA